MIWQACTLRFHARSEVEEGLHSETYMTNRPEPPAAHKVSVRSPKALIRCRTRILGGLQPEDAVGRHKVSRQLVTLFWLSSRRLLLTRLLFALSAKTLRKLRNSTFDTISRVSTPSRLPCSVLFRCLLAVCHGCLCYFPAVPGVKHVSSGHGDSKRICHQDGAGKTQFSPPQPRSPKIQ